MISSFWNSNSSLFLDFKHLPEFYLVVYFYLKESS